MTTALKPIEESASFLRWVRPPQQVRTRKTLVRLLDAAEEVIAEHGFDGAAISEIAKRANSSVGAIYRRFRDKEGLFLALHERFCEEARATTDEALDPRRWKGAPAAVVVDHFAIFLLQIFHERQGLFLAFQTRALVDPAMQERWQELFAHIGDRFGRLLRHRWAEIGHRDPELAIKFGLQAMFGTLTYNLRTGIGALTFGDARLETELSRLFKAYAGIGTREERIFPPRRKEPSRR